jgi:quinol-cytochrome oxidoreductase complex cytochrome b subunit
VEFWFHGRFIFFFILQVFTGIFLAMHYTPQINLAFLSVPLLGFLEKRLVDFATTKFYKNKNLNI